MSAAKKSAAKTAWIAETARSLGFDLCGVARADDFPELQKMNDWLERGYAGEMKYLHDPRRANLQAAMSGVKSAIVCAINYNSSEPYSTEVLEDDSSEDDSPRGWISRYAWGSDYHEVLWEKLNALVAKMRERFAEPFEARASADTGPVQERILAKHAGLGWIGKNTLLLDQRMGSWLFLGTILTDLELTPTVESKEFLPPDLCGTCTRCIDACPTDALVDPYVMDARRCIAYLTIELRGPIPFEFREPIGNHVFGCDICQDVCPWNRKSPRTEQQEFRPRNSEDEKESLFHPRLEWLADMNEEEYRELFHGSAMKRAKWRGIIRNALNALGNAGLGRGTTEGERVYSILQKFTQIDDKVISDSAQWALSRIKMEGSTH
ncbi:MAG TPA: tRNA epoxyqueuosine(34) reductase QueG [Candidatus Dormibacteraeota bacterium]|jgi:epoxyqueuosine reductase|nr:tRNA epoxyqueuosine(34) reductase QueG [Candidatus Dormibacteraeota bacterium]